MCFKCVQANSQRNRSWSWRHHTDYFGCVKHARIVIISLHVWTHEVWVCGQLLCKYGSRTAGLSAKPMMSTYPGSYCGGKEKEPGTHCLRLRLIAVTFHDIWILLIYPQHDYVIKCYACIFRETWISRLHTLYSVSDVCLWHSKMSTQHAYKGKDVFLLVQSM